MIGPSQQQGQRKQKLCKLYSPRWPLPCHNEGLISFFGGMMQITMFQSSKAKLHGTEFELKLPLSLGTSLSGLRRKFQGAPSLPGWRSLVVFLQGTDSPLGVCLYRNCVLCSAGVESHEHLFSQCPYAVEIWSHFSASYLSPPVITTRVLCLAEPGTDAIFPRSLNNFEASLSGDHVCSLERKELQNLQGHIFISASLHLPHR